MKNIIIALLAVGLAVTIGVRAHDVNEQGKACAVSNYHYSAQNVLVNFNLLAEKWGDNERCDTLLSNAQWAKINAHDITVEEAIALANLVEEAYEANFYSYADAIDDADFQMAVKRYTHDKEILSEYK